MSSLTSFADLLQQYMAQSDMQYTPGLVSRFSGVPKTTIVNWLEGRVARPRHWQDLVKVADALRLSEEQTNALLAAAGQPSIAMLRVQARDAEAGLLRPWNIAALTTYSARAPRWGNLPVSLTPLIGRSEERATLRALLRRPEVRVITLLGPGGVGKTRLALQVAADVREQFADGVCLVALASITDPDLVSPTIAHSLGIKEAAGEALLDRITQSLRDAALLLLIDNFEHVLEAAPVLAALLEAAPGLKLVLTSRVAVRLYGEHAFNVLPLALPDIMALPAPDQMIEYAAVALFVQRAQATEPAFRLTLANAAIVADICTRLDGLPLSIELAATRIKLLSPRGLLNRLANRLALLTFGSRDLPQRHQTLRSTLDWSYSLLDRHAQTLFARLAVFMGGWTLEAADAVCAANERASIPINIVDELMTLVDHSLVQRIPGREDVPRYMMLETIREYAQERLEQNGEAERIKQRHLVYYVALAETAEPELTGSVQMAWLLRLDDELDNVRVALRRAIDQDEPEQAGRLAGALRLFWLLRGYLSEGRAWLDAVVPSSSLTPATAAKVQLATGRLARQQGDLVAADAHLAASLALLREPEDDQTRALVLGYLGVVAYDQRDFERAQELHTQSLALRRAADDRWGIAVTLTNLGEVARQSDDLLRAAALQRESLALFRVHGDRWGTALALTNLGGVLLDLEDYDQAQALFRESLTIGRDVSDGDGIAECLEGLAAVAAIKGAAARAARLGGAASAIRAATDGSRSPADTARFDQYLSLLHERTDSVTFAHLWTEGHSMTRDQALTYALQS